MKKIIFLLALLVSCSAISQRKYAKEFSFLNDNDVYTSPNQDRYYSNGMFFNYRYLSNKEHKAEKKIYQYQIGHHIYTPFIATVFDVSEHDRPFAGYLYGSFGVENFYKNQDILKLSVQLGTLGSSAYGKELMEIVHDILGYVDAEGWKYQIANAFALNAEATYVKPLFMTSDNNFDVNWYNNAKIGTVFTEASTGLYTRIGFKPLQNLVNSIAFRGNLNNKTTKYNNEAEVFLYAKPVFTYVAYDATIQGSFLNDNSPVTYDIKHFKFSGEVGIRFTSNRFNFGYAVHFHSKKLESVRVPNTNFYGSLLLNYQFN